MNLFYIFIRRLTTYLKSCGASEIEFSGIRRYFWIKSSEIHMFFQMISTVSSGSRFSQYYSSSIVSSNITLQNRAIKCSAQKYLRDPRFLMLLYPQVKLNKEDRWREKRDLRSIQLSQVLVCTAIVHLFLEVSRKYPSTSANFKRCSKKRIIFSVQSSWLCFLSDVDFIYVADCIKIRARINYFNLVSKRTDHLINHWFVPQTTLFIYTHIFSIYLYLSI